MAIATDTGFFITHYLNGKQKKSGLGLAILFCLNYSHTMYVGLLNPLITLLTH
jgi:hypothetical protein